MSALPPDFRSRDFLLKHVQHTMDFYHPRAVDPLGGFYHYYKDDGTVYDTVTRHLAPARAGVMVIDRKQLRELEVGHEPTVAPCLARERLGDRPDAVDGATRHRRGSPAGRGDPPVAVVARRLPGRPRRGRAGVPR